MSDVVVAGVVIAREPVARGLEVRLVARRVAREQRQPRPDQPQLQVLAQEIGLRRREQRHVGHVHLLHPYQLPQLRPGFVPEPQPPVVLRLLRRGGRLRRLRPHVHRERQFVRLLDESIEPHADRHRIHVRGRLQPLDVPVDRLAQRRQLRPVHALQARVGRLQGDQRPFDVTGEGELLAGDEQRLFDFGVGPFVAVAR
ncbi:hypothetical protein D3C83_11480 [compost metagenome]